MLKSGTLIVCPECLTSQIKTTKDLLPGQQVKEAGFVSLGFDMEGFDNNCFKCSTPFIRKHPKTGETQFHTEDNGWISLSKHPTKVPKSKIIT